MFTENATPTIQRHRILFFLRRSKLVHVRFTSKYVYIKKLERYDAFTLMRSTPALEDFRLVLFTHDVREEGDSTEYL